MKLLDTVKDFAYPDTSVVQRLGIEGLMQMGSNGKLEPELASSVSNPDPITYVYTIRSGVKFWDGQTMTADDVVASLNRDRASASQLAQFYTSVASVTKTGTDQVTVKLKTPDTAWPFESALATPVVEAKFAAAHSSDIGAAGVMNMGTGPYEFVSFAPNSKVVLKANPNWWGGKLTVQNLTIDFLSTSSATALALRSGQIDGYITRGEDLSPYKNIPGITLTTAPGSTPMYMAMNVATGPWSDVHVRKAVADLVDRTAIIKAASGGYGTPLNTLLPATLLASLADSSQQKEFNSSYQKYDYSLAAAKQEMAQSKYPNGFSATWPVYPSSDDQALAQIMANNLKQIGINITIKQEPWDQFLAGYYGPRDKIGVISLTYGGATSPTYYYDLFLNSANAHEQGSNTSNFNDEQADALLKQAAKATSSAAELTALEGLAKIEGEQVPYIPLYTQDDGLALSSKYKMTGFSDYWQERPWAVDITNAG